MNRGCWLGTGLKVFALLAPAVVAGCGGTTETASCIVCEVDSDCTVTGESCRSRVCVPLHFAPERCAAASPVGATSGTSGSTSTAAGSSGASSTAGASSGSGASSTAGASSGSNTGGSVSSGSSAASSGGSGSSGSIVPGSSSTSSGGSVTSGGSTTGAASNGSSSTGSTGAIGPTVITLGQAASATNTVTVTLTQNVPAGWMAVAVVGAAGASSVTVSDSRGNTWGTAVTQTNFSSIQTAVAGVWFSVLSQGLSSGDTVVATFFGGGGFGGGGGGGAVAKALSVLASPDLMSLDTTGQGSTQSASTSFSATPATALSSATELLVGAAATPCGAAPPSFALSGGYSELQSWSTDGGSGIFGLLGGDALSGQPAFAATASTGPCTYATTVAAFEPGPPVSPTGLSLTHTLNSRIFNISFAAGRGNGGPNGCRVEHQQTNGSWRSDGFINCDADASALRVSMSNATGLAPWNTAVPVRLVRASDGAVLGQFPQKLSCSPKAGSSVSSPNVDEDCDGTWDNTTCTTYGWAYQSTKSTSYSACTDSAGVASTYACTAATSGQTRYTDGQSQALNPSQAWSSDSARLGCAGSNTGAVAWLCVGSNCTYY